MEARASAVLAALVQTIMFEIWDEADEEEYIVSMDMSPPLLGTPAWIRVTVSLAAFHSSRRPSR